MRIWNKDQTVCRRVFVYTQHLCDVQYSVDISLRVGEIRRRNVWQRLDGVT